MDASERFRASLGKILASSTKAEICRAVGIHRPLLDAYLTGRSVPSLNQAERIAVACGTTLEAMLSGSGPKIAKSAIGMSPQAALRVLTKFVKERG